MSSTTETPSGSVTAVGESDREASPVRELRTAFSGTTFEARDHAFEEYVKHSRESTQEDAGRTRNVGGHGMKRVNSAPGLSRSDEEQLPKIVVGVCAMDKKARSKQMRAIIERLLRCGEFEVNVFGDDMILNVPVEQWPVCDCLLAWHSEGFPLEKAQAYAALRKPYLVNDVFAQNTLLDRRLVYRKLTEHGIPVPKHIIIDRDTLPPGVEDPPGFIEHEDYVELDGTRIHKPFVEKPASGEDHNVYIYYPHSMGGGVKRLFRKVDNRSADYDPSHPGTVRRDGGSYIYEEFLTTGGTDVKVYTVGPRYAHAEARKSPVVDGKVQRTADGKEVRYPVMLSPQEKEVARMVCLAFGQRVCGFDLLRSERGRSYVCDVNGWSFVKNSQKYYDDTAGILRMIILSAVAPHRLLAAQPPGPLCACDPVDPGGAEAIAGISAGIPPTPSYDDLRSKVPTDIEEDGKHADEELRCVLAVIRHGDRTPKQKMKMRVTQPQLLALLHKYMDSKGKQAKLKSPKELQELLDVTRTLLEELEASRKNGGHNEPSGTGASEATAPPSSLSTDPEADELREKFRIVKTVLEQGGQFAGINRKVQLKPLRWEDSTCVEALLILKHGGVLTHAGRQQAEALGSVFRNIMYPNQGPNQSQSGLLRLHSTYRHDLKIYSSDEGRVQTSAAAFTKGLLDLEGAALTPILVSLVLKDAGMLDAFGKGASADIIAAKQELYSQMTFDPETNSSTYAEPAMTVAADATGGNSNSNSNLNLNDSVDPSEGFEPDPVPAAGSSTTSTAIYPMPEDPLGLLRRLYDLIKLLVDALREKCLEEGGVAIASRGAFSSSMERDPQNRPPTYSALIDDPKEWTLSDLQGHNQPCGGEKLLLMFDRWRKLLKGFYSEKKGQFDISKVPDIYDAAKYDSIHNGHLGLRDEMRPVYEIAKELAAAVVPNEYGIDPAQKLRIGSTICTQLLGKLLADLASMREESVETAGEPGGMGTPSLLGDDEAPVGAEADEEDAVLHRLCPTYAQDINSPLRHVRTRIYFTSESHCHALVNVLRYCGLCPATDSMCSSDSVSEHGTDGIPIVGEGGQRLLHSVSELDYMTHIVFRMFENKKLALDDPRRFRVEILFSPGAAHDPYEVLVMRADHVVPIVPRVPIHGGGESGVPLASLEAACKPFAKPFKRVVEPYAVRGVALDSQVSEVDYWM
jgi:inositol hexakisphosphate/diphosphoinositol-pentakisphosphate kinase